MEGNPASRDLLIELQKLCLQIQLIFVEIVV